MKLKTLSFPSTLSASESGTQPQQEERPAESDTIADSVAPMLRDIGAWLIQISGSEQSAPHQTALPMLRDFEPKTHYNDEELLARLASLEYRRREHRRRYFDPAFFGEPAWDMLLDLYVSRVHGRSISVSSALIASNVPPTTALRWLGVLEEQGLVLRSKDRGDERRSWVSLSDSAFLSMSKYFADVAKRQLGREICVPGMIPRVNRC